MLDLTGIMFSTIMMLLALFRAIYLDSVQPWFARPVENPGRDASREPALSPWKRKH